MGNKSSAIHHLTENLDRNILEMDMVYHYKLETDESEVDHGSCNCGPSSPKILYRVEYSKHHSAIVN